jgi:hypothetical protein
VTEDDVYALPRRTAHAVHALMEVRNDRAIGPYGPFKAREVMLYDEEALSPASTGAALREARKRALVFYVGHGLWSATNLALDNRAKFEARYLADTDSSMEVPSRAFGVVE